MSNLEMIKPKTVQNIITKFCYTIGMIPTSYKISLTYEEQILAIGKYLEETVYPAINNNAEALAELQVLFAELRNYVNNYFDDLDVQTEIDNKLDEMAEDGTLASLITSYLKVNGVLAFDTVASMIASPYLIEGNTVKTCGRESVNDLKGAYYKIVNLTSHVADGINTISLGRDNLYAQLLYENKIITFKTIMDFENANNLTKYDIVQTLGFHSINDGGSGLYYIVDTIGDDDMHIDLQNNLYGVLVPVNEINVKQFGAMGDGVTDDTAYILNAVYYANLYNLPLSFNKNETYLMSSALNLKNKMIINGNNATLNFTGLSENITFDENAHVIINSLNVTNSQGIAIHINTPNVKNTIIENNTIKSKGYGVLVNTNSDGGEDLKIVNNNIDAYADPIEINTTSTTNTKFRNVTISNNILKADNKSEENPTTAGFSVGIATGKNIIVTNNISKYSRNEAIHIEDGSESIIVANNILDNCKNSGIVLYKTASKSEDIPLIINNIIKSQSGNGTTGSGISITNTTGGQFKRINFGGNYIKGFANGITTNQTQDTIINCDGMIVENCNQFISGQPRHIAGHVELINTPIIGNFTNRAPTIIDDINIGAIQEGFIVVNANAIVTINKLHFTKSFTVETKQQYYTIQLMKVPSWFDCNIAFKLRNANGVEESNILNHSTYNSTDGITNKNIAYNNYGAIDSVSKLLIQDGYLCIRPYLPNANVGNVITVDIEMIGNIVFQNY